LADLTILKLRGKDLEQAASLLVRPPGSVSRLAMPPAPVACRSSALAVASWMIPIPVCTLDEQLVAIG
jgi:hypothetical protein